MAEPTPEAYQAGADALDEWIAARSDIDDLWAKSVESAKAVVDAVWPLAVRDEVHVLPNPQPDETFHEWAKRCGVFKACVCHHLHADHDERTLSCRVCLFCDQYREA